MIKLYHLIFLLIITKFQLRGCIGRSDDQYLEWRKNKKLTWNDFNGVNTDTSELSAGTYVQLNLNYKLNYGSSKLIRFYVSSVFSKSRSWSSVKTDYLLRHEQGHFDIGEMVARKLRERLYILMQSGVYVNEQKIRQVYHEYNDTLSRMQVLYDSETNHSRSMYEQERWNEIITNELNTLNKYEKRSYK